MRKNKMIWAVIVAMMLAVYSSNAVSNASAVLEIPIQAALDKLNASKDNMLKSKVNGLSTALLTSQEQAKSWDLKIVEIHSINDEALIRLQQEMKEIDVVKIDKLAADLEKTKDRYRPVITAYNPLNTMLGSKIKIARAAVQLARADIELKQAALKKAKDAKAATVRKIRATLAQINAYKVQIKAAKSNASLQKNRMTAAGKSFNQAVKNGDMNNALTYLTTLTTLSRQIVEQKQNIHATEKIISSIIIKAKDQMPA
ncbi:MAG: hypothetical protein WD469_05490 [Paenibacillaceae bacterium]